VGNLLSCEQQLCLAHGINLGVVDVLHKKLDSTSIEIDDEVNCDSDDEEDDGFQNVCIKDDPELTDDG
jgi:hypothetical protein